MTPCTRGVSDLGCGRGHDRRRGQISWSLTPRSYSLTLSLPWQRFAVGEERRPCSPSRKSLALIRVSEVTEAFGRPAPVDQTGRQYVDQRGNTPRKALFPSVPPLWSNG